MNYFITAIYDEPGIFYYRKARRTFGYFNSLEDALKAVKENRSDMQEYFYNYIVVEGIGEGIHPLAEQEIWFEWKDQQWALCNKPEFLKSTINFALG